MLTYPNDLRGYLTEVVWWSWFHGGNMTGMWDNVTQCDKMWQKSVWQRGMDWGALLASDKYTENMEVAWMRVQHDHEKIIVEKLVLDGPFWGYVQKGNVLTRRGFLFSKNLGTIVKPQNQSHNLNLNSTVLCTGNLRRVNAFPFWT